jgi:prepilin-type N-terminal cleavage/methylation domain-containing protein
MSRICNCSLSPTDHPTVPPPSYRKRAMKPTAIRVLSSHVSFRRQRAFTLIEVMIVVAIIAILAAIAIPSYRDYIIRGRITDATTGLSTIRTDMERYFQDNRTYAAVAGPPAFTPPCSDATAAGLARRTFGQFFVVSCLAADGGSPTLGMAGGVAAGAGATAGFTLAANGTGPVAGFRFLLDNQGQQSTTGTTGQATGWGTDTARWCIRRGC